MQLELIHSKAPGRARFEARDLYRAELLSEWVRVELTGKPGIRQVSVNPLIGSLTIRFDPRERTLRQISRLAEGAIRRGASLPPEQLRRRSPARAETPWHRLSAREVAKYLKTSADRGISSAKARKRLTKHGRNRLPLRPGVSEGAILARQFVSSPVLLLAGAAALSIATGGLADAIVILAVVGLNGYIGFLTEAFAEKHIQSLGKTRARKVTVIRAGRRKKIRSSELVPGDLIVLSPGDWIPADARLVRTNSLQVDEAILTGESLPVLKSEAPLALERPALPDLKNLVFRGTAVTGGTGLALVVNTGARTEIGRIGRLMAETRTPETPLQAQLRQLGNQMVVLSVGASAAVFLIGWLRGLRALELLKVSASLAIAAIPESLPTIATTTLAQGIRSLQEHGIVVRRLDALETLGGIDVLCLDKTGTLTLNEMSVTKIRTFSREIAVSRELDARDPALRKLIEVVTLCNEASETQGSSTERALLELAPLAKLSLEKIRANHPREAIHFRQEGRNFMSTAHRLGNGRYLLATKGRPSEVLKLCSHFQDGTRIRRLTPEIAQELLAQNQNLAAQGLRVLGVAFREDSTAPKEEKLIWLGLTGMEDPLRPGVHEWIKQARLAGIRTVMITGDQTDTARAIGHAVGLGGKESLVVVDSRDLDFENTEKLGAQVRAANVFSKVSPADKLKIIKALQSTGEVVAMAGDGINDGPALKVSDVGIALTSPGMEITSQVADMVLLRNELEKLALALREGRRVQEDIRKAVEYILTQNAAEILFTLLSIAIGLGEPLTPMQLLWMNLVTDIFPELALAQEPAEKNILKRPPLNPKHLLPAGSLGIMTSEATILALSSIFSYFLARQRYGDARESRTVGFLTLVTSSLLYTMSARSESPQILGRPSLQRNLYIPMAMGAGFVAESAAVLIPFLRRTLGTKLVQPIDLLESALGSVVPLLLVEILKVERSAASRGAQQKAA